MKTVYMAGLDSQSGIDSGEDKSIFDVAGLLVSVSFIVLFGLTMLYSTSFNTAGTRFFFKQLIWAGAGTASAFFIFFAGYRKVSDYSIILLAVVCGMLLVAYAFFPAVKGAHRWIKIPGAGNIQPSEFAKLALILFLSKYCSEKMRYLNDFSIKKGIIPVSLICMLVLGLIFIGKDWGTTFLLGAASAFVFFAAGLKFRYLLFPIIIFMPLGVFYIKNYDAERWSRMTTYLNPEAVHKTDGYQLWNSLLALGSGGWGGLGFMESRMKAKYLPEAHTDFILSIVGEELGYAGLLAVLFLYASFMFFALRISIKAGNKQGMLLGVGITSLLALQAVINIGVISGALPTKGMPAPFISYGGSNLVMALSGVGLLVSIGVDSVYPGFNRELLFDIKSKFFSLFGKDQ